MERGREYDCTRGSERASGRLSLLADSRSSQTLDLGRVCGAQECKRNRDGAKERVRMRESESESEKESEKGSKRERASESERSESERERETERERERERVRQRQSATERKR